MKTIIVCCGTGCLANGSMKIADEFRAQIKNLGLDTKLECDVKTTGCNGLCEKGPLVRIEPDNIAYYKVKPEDVSEILEKTIQRGELVERLLHKNEDKSVAVSLQENPFYKSQVKIALRNVGKIDPKNIDEYIANGGYEGLKKALYMTPEEIISEVEKSGLRGRGGAGFPTGTKWRNALSYENFPKYVVCNGDEGDPGAFMDGSIMEGDPHSVLEGMAICAVAIGAEEGVLYIRDEYKLARERIQGAIKQAEERGFLGEHIMGTDKKLKLTIVRGGGAFVCGESTALMQSIEGKVGEPRAKYIRSVQRGLWDHPTVLNNVETLANVPYVLLNGGDKLASIGTESCKGTKVFAMVGKVKNTGLVEVPMGITLRELIFDIGGGIRDGREFKAVQTGGPSGGCIPASMLDVAVDFDSLSKVGGMMGSGGMIVMDDRSCMVEVARYYVKFLSEESCGKCTPCREGLRQLLHILTDICEGNGKEGDIELMEQICETMKDSSLCSLGKSAPNPVLSTIKYFRDEYEAHIKEHRCPAGVCTKLTKFTIDPAKCVGCGACTRACPAGAAIGEKKQPHEIDLAKCISCGSCREACKFGAVITKGRDE